MASDAGNAPPAISLWAETDCCFEPRKPTSRLGLIASSCSASRAGVFWAIGALCAKQALPAVTNVYTMNRNRARGVTKCPQRYMLCPALMAIDGSAKANARHHLYAN
jgi:hypothetical protein